MGRVTDTSEIIDMLLDVLILGAIVGTTIAAPNAIQVVGKIKLRHLNKTERERQLQRTLKYMQRRGEIRIKEIGDQFELSITAQGKRRNAKYKYDNMQIQKPKKWDESWRLVMFDVPVRYSDSRRALTDKLQSMGFKMLQKSTWVHPYPCGDQIEIIKNVYPELSRYIITMETKHIDFHNQLVRQFSSLLTSK